MSQDLTLDKARAPTLSNTLGPKFLRTKHSVVRETIWGSTLNQIACPEASELMGRKEHLRNLRRSCGDIPKDKSQDQWSPIPI